MRLLLHGLNVVFKCFLLEGFFIFFTLTINFSNQIGNSVVIVIHCIKSFIIQYNLLSTNLLNKTTHCHGIDANKIIDENRAEKLIYNLIAIQILGLN